MPTILEIDTRADTSAASSDLLGLGDDARRMGADLEAAGDSARRATSDLSGLGDGSDELASKSSQATGALGALAGGLEAVGLEQYAAGLEAAAIGTDVMSGAGDALNLIAETAAGRWIVTTAQTVAHTVATGAQTVATGAMAAAQGALNAVMSLNPMAIVVITVLALVAGIILAYKNSETFREIVQRVFEAAKGYVMVYVDAIQGIIDIVQSLPGIAKSAWNLVSGAVGDAAGDALKFITDLYADITGGIEDVKTTVAAGFSAAFAPISTAIGWVQDLIDKIAAIDFPDLPFGLGSRTAIPTGVRPEEGDGGAGSGGGDFLAITLTAAPTDKDAATRALVEGLREYFERQGLKLSLTETGA